MEIPRELQSIVGALPSSYLVGGCVRDGLLGLPSKDYDVEVFGLSLDSLANKLSNYGEVDLVGKSFGVLKLKTKENPNSPYDFSVPRTEEKTGPFHGDFKISPNPQLTLKEAASRRDLTINSIYYDPRENRYSDFYGGLADLKSKTLRHTSEKFKEDPLRPLRIFQFASRFDFSIAPETLMLCRQMANNGNYTYLPKERIGEEWNKFLLKSKNFLAGFESLSAMDWLKFFPEVESLRNLPQDPHYHPEGDVLKHTAHCLSALHKIEEFSVLSDADKLPYLHSMLCHDLGKATTTVSEWCEKSKRTKIKSPGHASVSAQLAPSLLGRINAPSSSVARACVLSLYHMTYLDRSSDSAIRELSFLLASGTKAHPNPKESIESLAMIVLADHSGRPPLSPKMPDKMQHILSRARSLGCASAPPAQILTGASLINQGVPPGKAVGVVLRAAYKAQLKGTINSEKTAFDWLRTHKASIIQQSGVGPTKLLDGNDLASLGVPKNRAMSDISREIYDLQLAGAINTKATAEELVRFRLGQSLL